VAENSAVPLNRIERILALMIATIGGLSVLSIIAIIVASVSGVDTAGGLWPMITVLPGIGLPIAFLLIVAFAIVSITRRRRIANDGGR
jgi:hypothetical protein